MRLLCLELKVQKIITFESAMEWCRQVVVQISILNDLWLENTCTKKVMSNCKTRLKRKNFNKEISIVKINVFFFKFLK
jgi:hypothetical protein